MRKLLLILSTLLFVIMTTNAKATHNQQTTYSGAVIGFILTELINGNRISSEVGNQEVARIKNNGTVYLIDKVFSDGKGGLLYGHPIIAQLLQGFHQQAKWSAHREWTKDILGNDAYETIDPMATDGWMYGN
jgi:hypothetical protein